MPAGTTWPRYIAAVSAMMLSMFAGAQTVHVFYSPLQDFESRVELERQKRLHMTEEERAVNSGPATPTSQSPAS